ncbi:MAG: spermidine/putrescine ABC transporter substrate-binding protein [Actinomycetota bacterium]
MSDKPVPFGDPAWIRGMTQRRMSRRDLFRYAGAGAGALGISSILAACGVSGEAQTTGPTAGEEGSAQWWADMKAKGPGDHLNFTNWPAYIDRDFSIDGPGSRPSLYAFTQATGIDVTYRADINSNEEFYAAIRPALESGQDTGHDIIVMSNFQELSEMIALGYLIELDPELHPNFDQYAGPNFVDPVYDPGNKYTMAWQSGITGIGYNTKYVDEPVTSLEDLLNPKYAGHVAMFNNSPDSGCMAMIELGIAPETSTPDDWQKAADYLQRFNESGGLRGWMDQSYLTAIENEDLWITMAWSGDILNDKLYFPEYATFEFTIPDAGAVIFIDNGCIPNKAANPVGAEMLMDWYYDPKYAAMLTEWNAYFTPVPDGGEIVQADAAAATGADKKVLETIANSPYVFPDAEFAKRLHNYRVLEGDEVQTWNDIFNPIFLT